MTLRAILSALICLHCASTEPIARTDDISFPATDGTTQAYLQSLPAGFSPSVPYDVLVVLHGCGASRWAWEISDRDEYRALREVAHQNRLVVIAPEYRGPDSWLAPAAEADLIQIITDIRRRYAVNRLLLAGVSMGGTAALMFSSRHPQLVDRVVAMTAATNLADIYETGWLRLQRSLLASGAEIAPHDARMATRLTMPIALSVGGEDSAVPPGSVRALTAELRAAGRPVILIDRHDVGHATKYVDALALLEFALGDDPL